MHGARGVRVPGVVAPVPPAVSAVSGYPLIPPFHHPTPDKDAGLGIDVVPAERSP